VVTSDKKVMFHLAFVCLFVCLSVSLYVSNFIKTGDRIFVKITPEMYLMTRSTGYILEVVCVDLDLGIFGRII